MQTDSSKTQNSQSDKDKRTLLVEGFELIEKYGENQTAALWKARQISLGRMVTLKILSEQLSNNPDNVSKLQLEARLAASIKHHGIVQIYDFSQSTQSGRHYFVMEHITGYSVGSWVKRKGKLPESDVLIIGCSVGEALGYAWKQTRIVHCDIKPENIMVDGDGTIKVTDLGLARVINSRTSQAGSSPSNIIGTPNYMSPEQIKGQKYLDCRSDIYSAGATLYHLLTGDLPFGDSDAAEVLRRQVNEDLTYPKKIAPGISSGSADLIMKMMAKNPAYRYQDWPELVTAINRIQNSARKPHKDPDNMPAKIDFSGQTMAIPATRETTISEVKNASEKPVEKSSAPSVKSAPIPTPKRTPAKAKPKGKGRVRRHITRFFENVRLVISLILLAFLGYYSYQRIRYNRDILHPLRMKIHRDLIPAYHETVQNIKDYIGNALSYSPNDYSTGEHTPAARYSQLDDEDALFQNILRESERNSPRAGEIISIRLKGRNEALRGELQRIGATGILLNVDQGTVMYPYVVMEEESRLKFFPEERARVLWLQHKAK